MNSAKWYGPREANFPANKRLFDLPLHHLLYTKPASNVLYQYCAIVVMAFESV